jgi:hypothetical protein
MRARLRVHPLTWIALGAVVLGLVTAPAGASGSSAGLVSISSPVEQQQVPQSATVPAVMSCEALTRPAADGAPPPDFTTLPEAATTLISSTVVAATANAPEYCDVRGYISPQVQFQLKLPTQTYQGRYLQQGCGGYCGAIPETTFPSCDVALGGDFAMAATDDGHSGPGGTWALMDQQLRIDYGYRAVPGIARGLSAPPRAPRKAGTPGGRARISVRWQRCRAARMSVHRGGPGEGSE